MSHITNIGNKIKEIRTSKNLTLKQLSEKTNLSIGFLSQVERGLSNIAIDSLQDVANALEVEITVFIQGDQEDESKNPVIRNFEKKCSVINPILHSYNMTHFSEELSFLPREYHLMPNINAENDSLETYHHIGQEWIYVIEGILTVTIQRQQYDLYPGDCITIDSQFDHNWCNRTNKVTRFITINTPNPLIHSIHK